MDEGRDANLSNPPDREINLAVRGPPINAHMFGQLELMISEMYSSVLSLLS